jgi:RHH-type transcriptional regulator, rel operon repressor / antitoxin RelB
MGAHNTISFRIPDEKKDELDRIAESFDRDRSWVINEAIDGYLDLYRWQLDHIDKAIRNVNAGSRTSSTEEIRGRLAKRNAEARKKVAKNKKAM